MARKKDPEKPPNHERWLVSYGDFITLLFAVFVTLYAMSQVSQEKIEKVVSSTEKSFGITLGDPVGKIEILKEKPPSSPTESAKKPKDTTEQQSRQEAKIEQALAKLMAALKEQIADESVELNSSTRGLVVSLRASALFEKNSAGFKRDAYPVLAKIADVLALFKTRLSIEGHTGDQPVASSQFHSNWDYSLAMALSVAKYFTDRSDFSPDKVSVTGYGQYRPIGNNTNKQGRDRNCRVNIVLLEYHQYQQNVILPYERK